MPVRALVFLVDSSGSMDELLEGERKIEIVCEVIFDLLSRNTWLSGDDLASLMFFHATKSGDVPKVDILFPLTRLSKLRDDLESLRRKARKVKPAGGTPIGFGLRSGVEVLAGVDADEKRIILFTDGENNVGILPEDASIDAKDRGIRVDVIGIGDEINPLELEGVAERTGGRFKRFPRDGGLPQILEDLVGEAERRVEKPVINERDELFRLLAEFNRVRDEIDVLTKKLEEGKLGLDEYSRMASELEFRKRDLTARIRDIRSEISKKLLSARMKLAELGQGSSEAEELELFVSELKRLLEESEVE